MASAERKLTVGTIVAINERFRVNGAVTLPERIKRVMPGAAVTSLGGATETSIGSIPKIRKQALQRRKP